uniref:NADH-ubiquinone oxidoreductase chain 4 n=1 Tax=Romanomermis nielseni TaxID=416167 RepID=A1Z3A4_9BILA|nr:NADH dehydrogenase subunit 4 [Romanomermis nielseni]ABL73787.1 NADH dehydrogenase subunit 4 [Romanomermis nielseni]
MYLLLTMMFTMSFKEIMEAMTFYFCIFILVMWMILNLTKNMNYNNLFFVNLILMLIMLFMNSLMLWKFYLLYELVMLPMTILLLSWGVNPARLSANLYLLIYMGMFSLPCLLLIILNLKIFFMNMQHSMFMMNFFCKFIMILMFLVKIPLFSLHYWLPKAHTEASTSGSIILASGLLKMGGMGLWKMLNFMQFNLMNYYIILSLSLLSCLVSTFQTDFKKLIALISVFHMSLSVSILFTANFHSYLSFMYLNMTHILSSGILFYYSGFLYSLNKTRLIFLLPMNLNSKIFFLLIIIILMNLGIPPFFTFFVEILNLSVFFYKNFNNFIMIMLILVIVAVFNLFILNSMKMMMLKTLKFSFFISFYFIFMVSLSMWHMI